MGKTDVLDRTFFADPERFAELVNMEIYHGERILVPERLKSLKRSYPLLASASGEKCRDVMMHDTGQNVCYGLEIETESDYSMPERVMVYDASEYEYQIRKLHGEHRKGKDYRGYREMKSRMKETDFLIPSVTLVLYVGEGHWCGRTRLQNLFKMPEQSGCYARKIFWNYGFPLLEADFIDPQNYRTDLREFFQAMQCRGDKKRLKELFQTEDFRRLSQETEWVIAAHIGNGRFYEQVEEGLPVCRAFEEILEEERAIGREEGLKEGRKESRIWMMQKLLQAGLEESLIMSIFDCTKEEIGFAALGR